MERSQYPVVVEHSVFEIHETLAIVIEVLAAAAPLFWTTIFIVWVVNNPKLVKGLYVEEATLLRYVRPAVDEMVKPSSVASPLTIENPRYDEAGTLIERILFVQVTAGTQAPPPCATHVQDATVPENVTVIYPKPVLLEGKHIPGLGKVVADVGVVGVPVPVVHVPVLAMHVPDVPDVTQNSL